MINKIAVIPNAEKEGALSLTKELINKFNGKCDIFEADCDGDNLRDADVALVLGGDGTMLRAVQMAGDIPLLGINFGTLGYMTAVDKSRAEEAVEKLISGDYTVERRMMLDVKVIRGGNVVLSARALNDGVISRGERILLMKEYFDNKLVYKFSGDGLIVATPTGSTAYSLAAGGPVAPGDMQMIITTPVCPHSIYIRPVIASSETTIAITVENKLGDAGTLNIDGQTLCHVTDGDRVEFTKSSKEAKLVFIDNKNFYDVLRYKLSAE